MMTSQFDDEELSMSLSNPPDRRTRPSDASQARARPAPAQQVTSSTSDLPTEGRAGQRIGQYTVKKTLGEGSFGKVKLAVHRVSGQEVALKIISRRKLISRDMAGRVEREIQYLQLLRHPHIIKLYTVITTPNEIIMVLEYAGGELFDYLVKNGKMSEDKARRFFQQIICAVEYCHRHKIVHRDLKPENLLLDSDLNVKIADFGLSNIMTDGNFLKTSCGSPNYAAPEVISGKLYAGPEVDVWSSGIILYVLLVGRLPFDDDFIPSLFRKINSGNYHMPSYLSAGARHLIHKMLKVNPVQRITIQEIRQDPWFNENLEDYLKPPVEEFLDTGVDPNKAIDPRKLAPGKPAAVQEQIHQSIIGKLGKTMGYARDDVQEALGKDDPNAIKDAYLILRENQIMRENPALTTATQAQPFMAQSPPAWDTHLSSTPQHISSPLSLAAEAQLPSMATNHDAQPELPVPVLPEQTETKDEGKDDTYVSKVGILTSSLPWYHNQYMEQQRKNKEAERLREARGEQAEDHTDDIEPHDIASISQLSIVTSPSEQTPEEQAETARRLRPHSRSSIQLQKIISQPRDDPDENAKTEAKKHRTRWQFGIRSRNLPHEAMHCVYKALQAQGAEWEVPPPPEEATEEQPKSYPVHVLGATDVTETLSKRVSPSPDREPSSRPEVHGSQAKKVMSEEYMYNFEMDQESAISSTETDRPIAKKSKAGGDETDDEDDDPNVIPQNYIPKDPWCIHVRWRKDGMIPAGMTSTLSAHNSHVDLVEHSDRRISSAAASVTSLEAPGTNLVASGKPKPSAEGSCYVYMDVQLYTLEPGSDKQDGTFLVDFKCAGYESVIEKVINDSEKVLVGSGHRVMNKDVTSPQPFLDLANRLVIYLAGGNK